MKQPLVTSLLKAALLFPLAAALNSYSDQQVTLSLSTASGSAWTVSGGGLLNASPYVLTPAVYGGYTSALGITTTGRGDGVFLPGTSQSQFAGFWRADFTFNLPANAYNVSLSFTNLTFADRGVLSLNGNRAEATGTDAGGVGATRQGYMVLTEGGASQSYSFDGGDYRLAGVVNSGFNIGGANTLEAVINNTTSGTQGSLRGLFSSDTTYFGVAATLSYNLLAVPEPSTGVLFLGGLALLGVRARRPRR